MDATTIALIGGAGAAVASLFGVLAFIESRRARRLMETFLELMSRVAAASDALASREHAPLPSHAEQVKRPAPDAEEGDSDSESGPATRPERATLRPPAPELGTDAGGGVDRAGLVRDLDEADQAQAEEARQPSGEAPAVAPPAATPVLPPGPAIIAAGLGERPQGGRDEQTDPPPHKPPTPAPPAAPAVLTASNELDSDDEATMVRPRPSLEELGLPPSAQGGKQMRAKHGTLLSIPVVAPPSARPAPVVQLATKVSPAGDNETSGKPPTS